MDNLIGQQFGQYKVIAALGKGGMAQVYRALQVSVEREVALKVISTNLASDPQFVQRFQREARTIAKLNHPNILKMFDFGQYEGVFYLVTELQSGGSLDTYIRRGALMLDRAARIIEQLGSALDYAHQRSLIHRDLKPQNVLLDEQENAILSDFGLAKLMQADSTSLSMSGVVMGSPSYMSPEQWRGDPLDARSDIYALGVMAFEMVTGRLPFRADTPISLMYKHLNEPVPSIATLVPMLPAELNKVVSKALAKSPDQRYQTAGEFASAFRQATLSRPLPPPIQTETRKPNPLQHYWLLGILSLLTITILGVIIAASWNAIFTANITPTSAQPISTVVQDTTIEASLTPSDSINLSVIITPSLTLTITDTSQDNTLLLGASTAANTTNTPTRRSSRTPFPTITPSYTRTASPTGMPTYTATHRKSRSPFPTVTASYTRTALPTHTPTITLTHTATFMASIMSNLTATFAPSFTFTPTPEILCVVVVAYQQAYLRVSPAPNARIASSVARQDKLDVLRQVIGDDSKVWYYVMFRNNDAVIQGYIISDRVSPLTTCPTLTP